MSRGPLIIREQSKGMLFRTELDNDSITLPTNGTTNNYSVDWGDGVTEQITTTNPSHTYTLAGDYIVLIAGVCTKFDFKSVPASRLNLIKVYSIGSMSLEYLSFYFCLRMTHFSCGPNCDTSQITDMSESFYQIQSCQNFDDTNLDTSNVTNMSYMFYNSFMYGTHLKLNNLDTSKVTNMAHMFSECFVLLSLEQNFDTSNVTDMSYMFRSSKINTLDLSNFNTSKVTNMKGMFKTMDLLTTITLSSFDTSKVTNMSLMFSQAESLLTLDVTNFNTYYVTDMEGMFYGLNITSLDISNFSAKHLTSLRHTFCWMSNLTTLNINLRTLVCNDFSNCFYETGDDLCITSTESFTTVFASNKTDMFLNSSIAHPTTSEQADLTDANGATYGYSGC